MQARSVVPVLPFTWPRSAGRRRLSVPLTPATASEPTNADLDRRSPSRPSAMTPTSASAVRRSRLESPDPSTIRTPSTGMPASRIVAITSRPPPADVPTLPVGCGKLLEQHLGVEVVALVIHVADDRGERVGDVRCQRHRIASGATPRPGASDDRDAATGERLAERSARRAAAARAPASRARDRRRGPRAEASRRR